MRPRTNFDVIKKSTNKIIQISRRYDCFGEYTNSKLNLSEGKDHIIRYYLPEHFLNLYYINKEYQINTYNNYYDKLIFNNDEIDLYLKWLNEWIPTLNIKRVEDTYFNNKLEYDNKFILAFDCAEKTKAITLDIDLTKGINDKDRKLHLFLARYLINSAGSQVLKQAFKLHIRYPEMTPWDCFIMNEFIEFPLMKKLPGYCIFSTQGLMKYFTIEEFYDKVIVNENDNFLIESTYSNSGLVPYCNKFEYSQSKAFDEKLKRIEVTELYNQLGKTPEFLQVWKDIIK